MNGGPSAQTKCIGGEDCPLGLAAHPPASENPKLSRFPLGCSLCRSENLDQIVSNDKASAGVNIERRQDMKERFADVHGHDLANEIVIMRPRVAKLGEVLNIADRTVQSLKTEFLQRLLYKDIKEANEIVQELQKRVPDDETIVEFASLLSAEVSK